MKYFTFLFVVITVFSNAQSLNIDNSGMIEPCVVVSEAPDKQDNADCGMLSEIVVVAPKYRVENRQYCGSLPELVVTAPRFEGEDIAYCGMFPEIVVLATRSSDDLRSLKGLAVFKSLDEDIY
jgi:hypothetical protein